MNYLKHLIKNPLKILWILGIYIFTIVVSIVLVKSKDEIVIDNSVGLYIGLWIFISLVFLIANYQPYKEYKDGL
jgi:hypothetical protein